MIFRARNKRNLSTYLTWMCAAAIVLSTPAQANVSSDAGPMEIVRFNPWGQLRMLAGGRQQFTPNQTQSAVAEIEQTRPQSRKIMKGVQNVSPGFQQEINNALAKVPEKTVAALERAGYKISLSKMVTDAVPSAKNQQVRGYEKHATWNSVYGMFNRTTREVVMAEYAEGNAGSARGLVTLNNQQRREGILRHELGHAVDQYLGNFSHSPEFKKAYQKGLTSISQPERKVLFYYLQPGDAGLEETFAELFACMNETACDKNSDLLLRNHFGELLSLVRTKVAAIR